MDNKSFTDLHDSDNWTISILVRDINGKRRSIVYASREDLLRDAADMITEEDELLMVMWGEIMLYNALVTDPEMAIMIDDLIGFFG